MIRWRGGGGRGYGIDLWWLTVVFVFRRGVILNSEVELGLAKGRNGSVDLRNDRGLS